MILLTTPTGNIGSKLLRHLLDNDSPPFRVIVRDPNRLPDETVGRIDVITGSLEDPNTLHRAFDGVEAIFWCQPDTPFAEDYIGAYEALAALAAGAIRATTVPRVVAISAAGITPTRPAGPITGLHRIEAALETTTAACRFLRCGSFFENLLWQWDTIVHEGRFTYAMPGHVPGPQVATIDIAKEAARWLLRSDWIGKDAVQVLGPENLSYDDMAAVLTQALERPVRYEESDADSYRSALLAQGFTPSAAQGHLDMFSWLADGYEVDPASTLAPTPTSLATWLDRDH